ncbi:MAG TPA: hypothetical protein VMF67_09085 [Rhizomicrobium sp.]|nr:hypothetical protein [Rhizomicrobium sp.]
MSKKPDERRPPVASTPGATLAQARAFRCNGVCALLVFAQLASSLPLFLARTSFACVVLGLACRGTLEVANGIARRDGRAELISAIFLCGYPGLAVQVTGIGIVSVVWRPQPANLIFAAVVALLALADLILDAPTRRGSSWGRSRAVFSQHQKFVPLHLSDVILQICAFRG